MKCRVCGTSSLADVQVSETAREREARWKAEESRKRQIEDATAILSMIEELRREEGAAVTICCQNPEGSGPDNEAVEIMSDWTSWQPFGFKGRTLRLALEDAIAEKRERSR